MNYGTFEKRFVPSLREQSLVYGVAPPNNTGRLGSPLVSSNTERDIHPHQGDPFLVRHAILDAPFWHLQPTPLLA